jgi:Mg2+ and Co2+ transporter CorA
MSKQTKITIETDSLLILRGQNSQCTWCPMCEAEREMIALENLGVISNLDRRALEEWLNSGEMHRVETADGSTLICLNSLLARVQNTKAS